MAFLIGNLLDSLYPSKVRTDVQDSNAPVYGVKWDSWPGTPERLYDAKDMVVQMSTNTVKGRDDFEDVPPFNVKECITRYNPTSRKREVLAYEGDADWDSLVASQTGDRMIEFPCFWYKRLGTIHMLISPKAKLGFKPSPAHFRGGVLYDKVRISKFMVPETGNNIGVSNTITYPYPTGAATGDFYDNLRNVVRAKGAYLFDLDCFTMLLWLLLIKHATNEWIVPANNSSDILNGGSEDILGLDGTNSSYSKLFGLENLLGSYVIYADGMYLHFTGTTWPSIYTGFNIENKNVLEMTKYSDAYTGGDVLWSGGVSSGSYYPYMNQIPGNDWLLLCTQAGSAFNAGFMWFPFRDGSGSDKCVLSLCNSLFGIADSTYAHSACRFFEFE